jgi:hypothetical protein
MLYLHRVQNGVSAVRAFGEAGNAEGGMHAIVFGSCLRYGVHKVTQERKNGYQENPPRS